ncbi:T9SS type A sorting domain-containing protein [uncultured Algibacter sp.]|uniref:T9SS type A sorting domain-containing protein n=1 Tax=uncultured Algibacter sp. TaxID=298659 RepID=UPI00321708D1
MKNKHIYTFIVSICLSVLSFAQTVNITNSMSPNQIRNGVARAFRNGGALNFGPGTFNINLGNDNNVLNPLIIRGNNTPITSGARVNIPGHYPDNTNATILNISINGNLLRMRPGCTRLTIRNLTWKGSGITTIPGSNGNAFNTRLDLFNVHFDYSSFPGTTVQRAVLRSLDNVRGTIQHITVTDFGVRAFAFNRRLSGNINNRPSTRLPGAFNVSFSRFIPMITNGSRDNDAIAFDSGNDEFPGIRDLRGSVIRNNIFDDCRGFASSKCKNLTFRNNQLNITNFNKDVLHIEEFSENITVENNTFNLNGGTNLVLISVGALQSPRNIRILDNTINQNGSNTRLGSLISGSGLSDSTISGNNVTRARAGAKYVNFFGRCGNSNITIRNFPASNVRNDSGTCASTLNPGRFRIIISGNDTDSNNNNNSRHLRANNNGSVSLVTQGANAPAGNNFLWDLVEIENPNIGNYYSIRNVATNDFLEVIKGPNNIEQVAGPVNSPYRYQGTIADLRCFDRFNGTRKPGFVLVSNGSRFAIGPGGNEFRSDLRPRGNNVSVFITPLGSDNRPSENDLSSPWTFRRTGGSASKAIDSINLKEETSNENILYPNPSTSVINISKNDHTSWVIYNTLGVNVKQGSKNTIDVSAFANGLYSVRLSNGKVLKFIKN